MTRFVLMTFVFCLLSFSVKAEEHNAVYYFSYMPDVPVMEGFEELEDQTLVFDKPAGRIVESFAVAGDVTAAQAVSFYRNILPQLGWREESKTHFVRNEEQLFLKIEEKQDAVILHFTLSPN